MSKVLDIDKFLKDNSVSIVINGKTYVVRDIPMHVQEFLKEDDVDLRSAVALLLGCDKKELEGYETVALSKILRFVQEQLLGEALNSPDEV